VNLLGFGVLLGYRYPQLKRWDIQYFVGPVLTSYQDSTTLVDFTVGGPGSVFADGQTTTSLFVMAGVQIGLLVDVHLNRNMDLFLGGHYQYYPGSTVKKSFYWQDPTMPPAPSLLEWEEDLGLSGPVMRVGVRYTL
jgi:hypothetical protein